MNSKIVLYKGRRGAGKTLTMVKDGLSYYLDDVKVYRNFYAAFGKYIDNDEILKLDKKSTLNNCVIMIDEIQIFFDSRRSMAKANVLFSNFIQQVRKRNITILCTTQFTNTIDLRLRDHVDIMVSPRYINYYDYDLVEVYYRDITFADDEFMGGIIPTTIILYNPVPLFNLYNTEEMIK